MLDPMAKRKGTFQSTTIVDIEQTSGPLALWPANLRGQFKYVQDRYGIDELTAKAWYKWRYNQSEWMRVLYLPEDKYAIIQVGPKSSIIVDNVTSPEAALKAFLTAYVASGGSFAVKPKSVSTLKSAAMDVD
jgi:hypothetical protein